MRLEGAWKQRVASLRPDPAGAPNDQPGRVASPSEEPAQDEGAGEARGAHEVMLGRRLHQGRHALGRRRAREPPAPRLILGPVTQPAKGHDGQRERGNAEGEPGGREKRALARGQPTDPREES